MAAGAVVADIVLLGSHGGLPFPFQFLLGAEALVGVAGGEQAVGRPRCGRRRTRSGSRGLRPSRCQATASTVDNAVDGGLGGALLVSVLDAQDQFAAVLFGEQPVEQGRPGPADVQVAGGAGGKRTRTSCMDHSLNLAKTPLWRQGKENPIYNASGPGLQGQGAREGADTGRRQRMAGKAPCTRYFHLVSLWEYRYIFHLFFPTRDERRNLTMTSRRSRAVCGSLRHRRAVSAVRHAMRRRRGRRVSEPNHQRTSP